MLKNISWSSGFFRLWVAYGLIVVIVTCVITYNEKPYMPSRNILYTKAYEFNSPDGKNHIIYHSGEGIGSLQKAASYLQSKLGTTVNPKYVTPVYGFRELDDDEEKDWFDGAVESGMVSTYKIEGNTLAFLKTTSENTKELKIFEYRKTYQAEYNSKLQNERIETLKIGLGFLIVPLLIGLTIKWILLGFRNKKSADIPPSGNTQ